MLHQLLLCHILFPWPEQLSSRYTQIIWPIMTYEESLSAIKNLYNSNYTIILLYRAADVLYEALVRCLSCCQFSGYSQMVNTILKQATENVQQHHNMFITGV